MALKNHEVKYLPCQMAQNYMHGLNPSAIYGINQQESIWKNQEKKSTFLYSSAISDI